MALIDVENAQLINVSTVGGGPGSDTDAIHDNVAGEIAAATEKATLHVNDIFLMEDSEATNAKKKALLSSILACAGSGGGNYTDRGDPAAYDYALGDLTTNALWHDLDLSSIITGTGAKLVHLTVQVRDADAVNSAISFRTNGNSNAFNRPQCITQTANSVAQYDVWVYTDANQVIEYTASNVTWTAINILVRGWFVEGVSLVDRGDPAARDFVVGDLTTDGTWRDLDLSSIIPVGASAVDIIVLIKDDAVGSTINFRKKGKSNDASASTICTQVANVNNWGQLTVFCDANRVIQYWATSTTWTTLSITVKAWYI